ncbi:MAG: hypothetical protein U0531_21505 [Dehalococcoidia bacterium]
MATAVTVIDEAPGGGRSSELTLEFLDERVSVRELIRARVYQEVSEYNARRPEIFRGLVQPSDAERTLNGFRLRRARALDWEAQYQRALQAFRHNGIIILVDDRQVMELDEVVDLRHNSTVTFLRLMPLVGG